MMKKYLSDKHMVAAIFLSILMVLTPSANAYRYLSAIKQPRVFSECSTKTMEICGEKFDFKRFCKVTYYSNGTTDVHFSITVENISKQIPRIQINYSKTVSPDTQSSKVFNIQSPIGAYYTGPLREYLWDNLFSLRAPGNATYWVKYDHDNNYWRYHPLAWNEPWEMQGDVKLHEHLAASDVNAWISGTITDEEMMGKMVSGEALAVQILGVAATAAIGFLTGGLLGLVLGIIAGVLADIFAWFLQVTGVTNKAQWIKDNVQLANDDGFAYYWGFKTIGAWGLITNPPIFDIYGPNDMHILLQHHRVKILMVETREFYEAWGAERNTTSPGRYTLSMCYTTFVNPGFFGTTDYDYGYGQWEKVLPISNLPFFSFL